MNDLRTKQSVESALKSFADLPLADAAVSLFESLGYKSNKRLKLSPNTRAQFLATFAQGKNLNDKLALPDEWITIDFLFQLTDEEILAAGKQQFLFDSKGTYNGAVIESYLFLSLELKGSHYTRTTLAGITRELNKLFAMPALVLFRYGDNLTLAVINRRLHKRDQTRDVLEKVTLIKDIAFTDPIRAHLEILNDFALVNLDSDFGVSNFVALHAAWQKRLGSYALSNNFYREIADWYFWAHHQVDDGSISLPQHCDTEQEKSLFLIRLLTRLIFCWFLVEKRLLPAELFRDHPLRKLLKDLSPSAPTYYHAVLQNLFFGTLNMPSEQRGFRGKKKDGERYDKNYGITNLWRYEADFRASADWTALATRVPFLNGGLFDCLDDKTGKSTDNFILDGFSDNPKLACNLPNDLFFGAERTVDLSKDYGDEDKRTARSKKAKVRGLIEILSHYKFTIEENTPLEEEIALDPELLGKVFENLLASYNEDTRTTARKALGAFYSPREIVAYMVDEALKSYLATQVPRVKGLLEDLFSNKANLKDIKPDQRDALIAAIGRVRILDPACGSGAFPMGALHRLVDLLQKLDPNNESWKRDRLAEARRYRALLEEAGAPLEEVVACDARIADIEKSFDTRFHALDFARKLYLIENSIYGVDIQPVAVQIAKLRFFIALVVDQKVDPQENNLGVRPLPNLETRLVAADTLIPIEKAESDLFSGEIDKLRADLTRIRHEHFNARDPRNKRKWREADAAKRQEIANLLEREHTIPRNTAHKLAAWDPYDQNTFAPFFDSEWMFGLPVGKVRVEGKSSATLLGNLALINEVSGQMEFTDSTIREIDSGFDIVIANPPYVRHEKISGFRDKLLPHYETAASRADLFVFFFERASHLLKENGFLCFISSNKYFRAAYGEKLRKYLAGRMTIHSIVDFGDAPVFKAIAYASIFLAKWHQPPPEHRLRTLTWSGDNSLDQFAVRIKSEGSEMPQSSLKSDGWNLGAGTSGILERLEAIGTPLKSYVKGRFYYGIKTGLNEAFVIDAAKREELIALDPISAELIRPWLRGRDVKRWRSQWGELYAIIFPFGFNGELSRYPAVLKHLKQFESDLRQRGQCTSSRGGKTEGQHHWLELDNNPKPSYLEEFKRPKVIIPAIERTCAFAYDGEGYFSNDKTTICVSEKAKFLCAVLNSSVTWWVIRQIAAERQNGYYEFKPMYCSRLPIPEATPAQQAVIERLVDYLLYLNNLFADHPVEQTARDPLMKGYYEQIMNGLVYELYFPEEVHGAGLRLFELLEQAAAQSLDTIPERDRASRLRRNFESLYDGTHPLKIALQKLQTLDVVRIIEGKA